MSGTAKPGHKEEMESQANRSHEASQALPQTGFKTVIDTRKH
jgi:hypothetical protein